MASLAEAGNTIRRSHQGVFEFFSGITSGLGRNRIRKEERTSFSAVRRRLIRNTDCILSEESQSALNTLTINLGIDVASFTHPSSPSTLSQLVRRTVENITFTEVPEELDAQKREDVVGAYKVLAGDLTLQLVVDYQTLLDLRRRAGLPVSSEEYIGLLQK